VSVGVLGHATHPSKKAEPEVKAVTIKEVEV
jgi:hypothetical protein